MLGSNERSVYKWTEAIKMKDSRILAIDAHNNVVALGDKRGHIFPFEEQIDMGPVGSTSTFTPLNDGGKRGSTEIVQVMYLPRCSMTALLSKEVINVVDSINLKSVQEIKNKKVHMFCLNNAVYSTEQNPKKMIMMDQICVCTTDR